jgi:hypothetical protein
MRCNTNPDTHAYRHCYCYCEPNAESYSDHNSLTYS